MIELRAAEQRSVKRIKRAQRFVFLHTIRHEFFDADLQPELNALYGASVVGQPPVPTAQVALAMIVQAWTGASDDEAIDVAVEQTLAHIARWQGDRSRSLTLRKNLFDLRRMAVVPTLHLLGDFEERLMPLFPEFCTDPLD
ncbi:MAG: hypothetical protein KME45_08125 [Stenomitos rutilans HA7619-LM2]|jgi:hypothetical protein|nr:hypothetical protein [Stenomitos rutilans HA7619-LM2]